MNQNNFGVEPLDFNEKLKSDREKDIKRHRRFNIIIDTNLYNIKGFLDKKYNVELIKDEEHSLYSLKFINKKSNNSVCVFSFDNIKETKGEKDDIERLLMNFVISLYRS